MAVAAAALFASGVNASSLIKTEAADLAPGSYLWNPSSAPDAPLRMTIDLASQRAFVYRGDTLVGVTTIASGKPGYETPDGTFTVLEKQRSHRSNKYDNAPMPYMQRLTWSGLALHGGHPRGIPVSHGCIRLPMGFAAALFKEDTRGMQVVITGHAPSRQEILAKRQNAPANFQPANLEATQFQGEQDEANPPQGDQQAPGNTDMYQTGQPPSDESTNVQDQGQNDTNVPENPPPPPPPG